MTDQTTAPPRVSIIGRTNVGKSTLFNRLVGGRPAIVQDLDGVTRDRRTAPCRYGERRFELTDTGGLAPSDETDELARRTAGQAALALAAADLLILVVDVTAGVAPGDQTIAAEVRRSGKPVVLAANKADSPARTALAAEFYALGLGDPIPISSEHGLGIAPLMEAVLAGLPAGDLTPEETGIRVAVVGRPNVGKSSFANALIGEERFIVSAIPGTTRDAVDTRLALGDRVYTLVDPAGIRRKGRTQAQLEKQSVIMALRSLERCDVAVLLVDALEGVTDQDAHIAGYVVDAGRACVVLVNKLDLAAGGARAGPAAIRQAREKLQHLVFAEFLGVSVLRGRGIGAALPAVDRAFEQYGRRLTTHQVNETLAEAQARHPPPAGRGGHQVKITFGIQGTTRPPTFVLFCNRPAEVHFSYRRYLVNQFRDRWGFGGTPVRLILKHKSPRAARKGESS